MGSFNAAINKIKGRKVNRSQIKGRKVNRSQIKGRKVNRSQSSLVCPKFYLSILHLLVFGFGFLPVLDLFLSLRRTNLKVA